MRLISLAEYIETARRRRDACRPRRRPDGNGCPNRARLPITPQGAQRRHGLLRSEVGQEAATEEFDLLGAW